MLLACSFQVAVQGTGYERCLLSPGPVRVRRGARYATEQLPSRFSGSDFRMLQPAAANHVRVHVRTQYTVGTNLVLGNCTVLPAVSFLQSTSTCEANLNLNSCKTQQNNTRSASCIMRRLPFPPPPNLQPFQHPCAPTGAGASPHSLRLRALSRVLIGRGPGAAVPYQVPTRYLPGQNLPSVPVQAPPSACIRYLLLVLAVPPLQKAPTAQTKSPGFQPQAAICSPNAA